MSDELKRYYEQEDYIVVFEIYWNNLKKFLAKYPHLNAEDDDDFIKFMENKKTKDTDNIYLEDDDLCYMWLRYKYHLLSYIFYVLGDEKEKDHIRRILYRYEVCRF